MPDGRQDLLSAFDAGHQTTELIHPRGFACPFPASLPHGPPFEARDRTLPRPSKLGDADHRTSMAEKRLRRTRMELRTRRMRSACRPRRSEYIMKPSLAQFYLDRADESRVAAADASLANVQKKHSEAEGTWRALADLATLRDAGGNVDLNVCTGPPRTSCFSRWNRSRRCISGSTVLDLAGHRPSTKQA